MRRRAQLEAGIHDHQRELRTTLGWPDDPRLRLVHGRCGIERGSVYVIVDAWHLRCGPRRRLLGLTLEEAGDELERLVESAADVARQDGAA